MNTKLLRSKVLQLAISGRLVPQDPNDEPAAELLKRINPKAAPLSPDDAPFTVPDSWCWCKVKDIFIINPRNKAEDNVDAGFVPMANICDGYTGNFTAETRKWKDIKTGFTHFADGDIAVAKISPCLENRKSMIAENLLNGIGAGTTELHVFRPLCVAPKYGLYFFKTNYFVNQCVATFNGVVGQQRVGRRVVEEMLVPLPPLAEQERIVKEVERWFACIEQLERSREALGKAARQTKRTLLSLAISGRLVPQDPNDEPAIALLRRINPNFTPQPTDSPLPPGWTACRLGELVNIISGVSYAKGDVTAKGIRILRGGNIQDGAILTYDDDVFLGEQYANSTNSVYKGDIVMVASTGSFIALGKTGYCLEDMENTQIGAFLRIIRAKDKALASFLNLFFLSDAFRKHIRNKAKGTNINNIKGSYITDYVFPLPPLAEQERIVGKVEELFAVLDRLSPSTH